MQNYKTLQDNTGENLDDAGYSNDLSTTLKARYKIVTDKLNFIKIKNCSTKDIVKRMRQAIDWQKISEKVVLIKN